MMYGCPKCQSRMEEGFKLEDGCHIRSVSTWYSGRPVRGLFGGVKMAKFNKGPIGSRRCSRCGFVENYAPRMEGQPVVRIAAFDLLGTHEAKQRMTAIAPQTAAMPIVQRMFHAI